MPIRETKIRFHVDLSDELEERNVKPHHRKEAAQRAGELAREKILGYTAKETSSVEGKGKWEPLKDTRYKKLKSKAGKGTKANLRLDGDMLGNLQVEATRKGFELAITDNLQKKKAYNHITGDTEGMPERKFLPNDKEGEDLKEDIKKHYLKLLDKYKQREEVAVEEKIEETESITSKLSTTDLMAMLNKPEEKRKTSAQLLMEFQALRPKGE